MTDDLGSNPVSPTIHLTARLFISLFILAILGSYLAKIEIVARGEGRIVPLRRVQVVQPQTDGKITAMYVAEGQSVSRGDLLLTMDTTAAESEVKRTEAEIERQLQDKIVALSIIEPLSIGVQRSGEFVEIGKAALHKQRMISHDLNEGTEALVVAVLSALDDQVAQINAQLDRIVSAERAQLARIEKARTASEILHSRFVPTEALRNRGSISNYEYLDQLRQLKTAESDVLIAERELRELAAEAAVMAHQRASAISSALSLYRKQLNAAEIALSGLMADLKTAQERLKNTSLRAPESGRIENLSVFTLGGYVEAGSALMSIVPSDGEIEVEAFFDNRDIGFLAADQRAFVKLDAFPAERFGLVRGNVASVGADAREQSNPRRWVYAVRIKLEQTNIEIVGSKIDFVSGMTATVDVVTGQRRLLSYFFEPILKTMHDSFGER